MATMAFSITADFEGIDVALRRLNKSWGTVSPLLVDLLNNIASELEAAIKAKAGTVLEVRTGKLVSSIKAVPATTSGGNTVQAGVQSSGIPYNRIHEYGGVIEPRSAEFLTIPVGAAKDTGLTAREVIDNPSILGYSGTFFKHQMLFGTPGADPLFILTSQVTIPERSYFRSTLATYRSHFQDQVEEVLAEILNE